MMLRTRIARERFAKICRRTARAIAKFDMIASGDNILVGLSGGEDSMLLMHVLEYLRKRSPVPFRLQAVTVDMNFAGFDGDALRRYCEGRKWPFEIVRLDGNGILREKDAVDRPCALCSRLRRGQLHAAADRLGCNKIALGHHLDDLCVSFLISLFRGQGLKTMGPNVPADGGSKRLIRPFCTTEKKLIRASAAAFGFPPVRDCPWAGQLETDGDRAFLERLLGQLEPRFQHIRRTILRSLGDLRPDHLLDLRFLTGNPVSVPHPHAEKPSAGDARPQAPE